ncbi:MAG: anti-sigma factor family protein [Candidatus Aminicenantes bacterium]
MRCLGIAEIYLYLEKELEAVKMREIEDHLASCPKCQSAVEERKALLQASESLPLMEAPPDFARHIMARIFPEKTSLRRWVAAAAAGFSSILLLCLTLFLISGYNLAHLLLNLKYSALNFTRNFFILLIKIVKLVFLLVKIIIQFLDLILESFLRLTSLIAPEVQIVLVFLALILSVSLIYGARKIFLTGARA